MTIHLPKSAKANAVIFGVVGGLILAIIGTLVNDLRLQLGGGGVIAMAFYAALPEKMQRSVWKEVKWYMRDLWES